jgi:Rrf2 family transcriptional regulator, iron-sulfur cluster assembly transcription factor
MRLQLTRRADYAIRTVICLGRETSGGWLPAPAIARLMGVPGRFLPQIMQDLVRAGLVEAALGRGGGYRLVRAPSEISLLEIIEAVEGDARRRTCVLSSGSCDPGHPCDVHALFATAQDALLERLADATVQDAISQSEPHDARDDSSVSS